MQTDKPEQGHYFQVVYLPDRDFDGMRMPSVFFNGEYEEENAYEYYRNLNVPYKALWEVWSTQYKEISFKRHEEGDYLPRRTA